MEAIILKKMSLTTAMSIDERKPSTSPELNRAVDTNRGKFETFTAHLVPASPVRVSGEPRRY